MLKGVFVLIILYDPLIHKLTLQFYEQMIEELDPEPGFFKQEQDYHYQCFTDNLESDIL